MIMTLKLRGITRKGKNRIKQFGEHWLVKDEGNFNGNPSYKVRPANGSDDLRWVFKNNDPDFEIISTHPTGCMKKD